MKLVKKIIMPADIQTVLSKDDCFLHRTGIRTFTTRKNAEAFAIHKSERADLIIARLESEDMPGETLCSLIRKDHELRDVSIIMVCSQRTNDVKRSLQCSANTFITTPINTAVLLQEAYQLLNIQPRTSCRVAVRIRLRGTTPQQRISGYADNLSSSGMLFRTDAVLDEGDPITCSFAIPNSGNVSVKAEIVRVMKQGSGNDMFCYGVIFIDPSHNTLSSISSYVDKYCIDA